MKVITGVYEGNTTTIAATFEDLPMNAVFSFDNDEDDVWIKVGPCAAITPSDEYIDSNIDSESEVYCTFPNATLYLGEEERS